MPYFVLTCPCLTAPYDCVVPSAASLLSHHMYSVALSYFPHTFWALSPAHNKYLNIYTTWSFRTRFCIYDTRCSPSWAWLPLLNIMVSSLISNDKYCCCFNLNLLVSKNKTKNIPAYFQIRNCQFGSRLVDPMYLRGSMHFWWFRLNSHKAQDFDSVQKII